MENNNKILTEKDKEKLAYDLVEESGIFINRTHAIFRRLGYSLTKRKRKAVVRVLEAFLFEPLETVELQGKEEKELLDLCYQIMYHKNKLAAYAVERKLNKEQNNEQE